MPSLFSDDLADGLRRMYLELRDRTEKLERQLPSLQRNYSREDFVLLQASTTGDIPAVTASTTGITPGKTTVAKMLTINSSDNAVRTTSDRTVTAYNFGTGSISAGAPFPAHREYLTGKFATWQPASGGNPEVFGLHYGSVTMSSSTVVSSRWGINNHIQNPTNQSFAWISWSTSSSTAFITFNESRWYLCEHSAQINARTGSTGAFIRTFVPCVYWNVLSGGDTAGSGFLALDRGRLEIRLHTFPSSLDGAGNGTAFDVRHRSFLFHPSTGTKVSFYTNFDSNPGFVKYGTQIGNHTVHIMPVNDGVAANT